MAFSKGSLRFICQPICNLDGRIVKFEVLARIQDGDRLLSAYDEQDRISRLPTDDPELMRWIDRQAILTALQCVPCCYAINLSEWSLSDWNLIPWLETVLKVSGRSPRCIHFEITEDVNFSDTCSLVLEAIKGMGFPIIADDFGTYRSTFLTFVKIAPAMLKIDGQFVRALVSPRRLRYNQAIVVGCMAIANKLSIPVIAEQVETAEIVTQLLLLRDQHYPGLTMWFQGWHFGQGELCVHQNPQEQYETPD